MIICGKLDLNLYHKESLKIILHLGNTGIKIGLILSSLYNVMVLMMYWYCLPIYENFRDAADSLYIGPQLYLGWQCALPKKHFHDSLLSHRNSH